MKDQSFIVYPRTKFDIEDDAIKIADAPLKVKLKAYITGYKEDHGELPSIERVQSIFAITVEDAHIALILYGCK